MKRLFALLLATALCLLSACGTAASSSSAASSPPAASTAPSAVPPSSLLPKTEPTLPERPLLDEASAEVRMKRFAAETAAAVLDGEGNGCYSPLSLYLALALAAQGAEGETLDELLAFLRAKDANALRADASTLMHTLHFTREGYGQQEDEPDNAGADSRAPGAATGEAADEPPPILPPCGPADYADPTGLSFANSVWMAERYDFSPTFSRLAQDTFAAELFAGVDFEDPATAQRIAQWIADNTGGLLGPGVLVDPANAVQLINTVYLADTWVDEFYTSYNTHQPFHPDAGEPVECEFMNQNWDGRSYIQGENYVGASLDLAGARGISGRMGFILPDEGVTAADLLADPEALFWGIYEENGELADVYLTLPKFSFDSSYMLQETLQRLGVQRAFDKDRAQLLGLVDLPEAPEGAAVMTDPIFMTTVQQETHIAIDERGVEAAAYTSIETEDLAAFMEEPPRVDIVLDRPFIFFICYNEMPVFVGVVANPAA